MDEGKEKKKPDFVNYGEAFRTAGPLLEAGVQMAVSVVVMFFLGRWLDGKFNTDPWLMVVGSMVGVGAGLYSFIRTALNADKADKRKKDS